MLEPKKSHDPNQNIRRVETKLLETVGRQKNKQVVFDKQSDKPMDIRKVQAALGEIDKNYGYEMVNKSESNSEVCQKIQSMFYDREIADPIIAAQVFQSEPKGELRADLIRRLQLSQKDMEHRLHPWMSSETVAQVKDLESEIQQNRRRTIRGSENLSGPQGKASFRSADRNELQESLDEFQTKQEGKGIKTGGKPGEGACTPQCSIF